MEQTEVFLEKYKELEQAIYDTYHWKSDGRAISRLEQLPQFQDVRQELDLCRQVRNLLQHNCRIGESYAVEPSRALTELLDTILNRVIRPQTCREICVPVSQLCTAQMSDPVWPVMQQMGKRGVSYVPILDRGRVAGVFSENSVFRYLIDKRRPRLEDGVVFSEIHNLITSSSHRSGEWVFYAIDTPVIKVEEAFESAFRKGNRISLVLLTEDGLPSQKLLGVITAWDLLGN